jgi:hypothetical protein
VKNILLTKRSTVVRLRLLYVLHVKKVLQKTYIVRKFQKLMVAQRKTILAPLVHLKSIVVKLKQLLVSLVWQE